MDLKVYVNSNTVVVGDLKPHPLSPTDVIKTKKSLKKS
jgi:hypothetical protein